MGFVFHILCSGHAKALSRYGRGLSDIVRSCDPQVFFGIGQTLFSSEVKASAAGMVASSIAVGPS
jgi:hypothetical protein